MSYTDQQVMEEIQYTMLEPPNLGASWPSGMWTTNEVVGYLQQRQDRILGDTFLYVGIMEFSATAGIYQYDLPDDWLETIRVVWFDDNLAPHELMRSDTWEADMGIPTWTYVRALPKLFIDFASLNPSMQIAPSPDTDGLIQLYYAPIGAFLDGGGELLLLPDELIPTLKYGVMGDMFNKVGRGSDPRAAYCEQRYHLGIELTKMLLKGFQA